VPNPLPAPLVLALAYLAGSVPVANLAARATGGPDLRRVGDGTVSGTALYAVSGFPVLALAGVCELAKGAAGPLLAGRGRPLLGAAAAATAGAAHNWSPWLAGKGGRGVSLLLGATLVLAPEAALALAAGLGGGRLAGETGAGTALASLALPPLLARRLGGGGALAGAVLLLPLFAKRLVGNDNRLPPGLAVAAARLAFDADRHRPRQER